MNGLICPKYPGLPDYTEWYSKQKNGYLVSLKEWNNCKQIFKEKGMKTFADWLKNYNNLDVEPFIEALNQIRSFYIERSIDILKML